MAGIIKNPMCFFRLRRLGGRGDDILSIGGYSMYTYYSASVDAKAKVKKKVRSNLGYIKKEGPLSKRGATL